MSNAITLNGLHFSYGTNEVLKDISFEFRQSGITAILGPNGSGKTTLLKLILGFLRPAQGNVAIFSHNLCELSLKQRAMLMAYVPQKHQAAFSYDCLDVVCMGRHPHGSIFSRYTDKDRQLAIENLNRMGIANLSNRPYTDLSGGEQQMVLIARALTQKAKVLILDEPVTGLDYGNQLNLLSQLVRLSRRDEITCIMTTHCPDHALWISDESLLLKDGMLVASGNSQAVINSKNLQKIYQAEFNVVEAQTSTGIIKTCIPKHPLKQ